MKNNWLSMLSLAKKANKVAIGPKVIDLVRTNKVYLVIIASDASDNTKKKLNDKCKFYNVDCIESVDSITLSNAIGNINKVYLGITDKNMAEGIKNKMKEE